MRYNLADALGDILFGISLWVDGALWRSWLVHTLGAVPICWLFGPAAVIAVFLFRELEQLSHASMPGRHFEPWYDYLTDVVLPTVFVALPWWAFSLPTVL